MQMSTSSRSPRASLLRAVGLELLLVVVLLGAYRYGRMLIEHSPATAFHNAGEMVGWEQTLHLPNELAVQHLLLSSEWLARFANIYYFTVHFPLTAGFLVWMFIKSREQYTRIRTSMAMLTGFALLIHAAFPLAGPDAARPGVRGHRGDVRPERVRHRPPARLGGQPVRRHAVAALRLGGAGRGRHHPSRPHPLAVAVDRAPDHHPAGHRRHRQPLLAGRRRRRRTDHRDRTRHHRLDHHLRHRAPTHRHQLGLAGDGATPPRQGGPPGRTDSPALRPPTTPRGRGPPRPSGGPRRCPALLLPARPGV